MFIKRIQIGKYRHLENVEIGPLQRPGDASDLVVLAGPNGSGKSSVLELASLALSSMWSLSFALNRTQPESSFEVTIGLLPGEIQLIRDSEQVGSYKEVLEHLTVHRSYCRSFRYSGGEYEKNSAIHDKCHDLVLSILRGSYSRPLGFYLGADRSYEKRGFERNNLFNYTTYSTRQHAWSYAFQTSVAQYRDMFDFLVTWRYHFTRRLGSYHLRKNQGSLEPEEIEPTDEYGRILNLVFPGYQFVDKAEDAPTDLFVRIPSGETISFSDLSSGEKEVFFTLCFFERHSVEDAVVIIDEPELHLHPNLARRLLRTMMSVKPRNQIWLATQNSEVVDEAGRDRVLFVRRNHSTQKGEVISAADEEESLLALRDLFGQAGYIGLAKAIIFSEGDNASADRKMFTKLLGAVASDVKIIPANGCGEVERINRAVLALLESNLAWCKFFLIRDRDFMTPDAVEAVRKRSGANLFVLERHEIENYLLDADTLSRVLKEFFDTDHSAAKIAEALAECAREISGNALRDMAAFRLNLLFKPQDFSVPKLQQGEVTFSEGKWIGGFGKLKAALAERADANVLSMRGTVEGHRFEELFDQCASEVEKSLNDGTWISLLPGKDILDAFCKRLKLGKSPVLQNAIIKELSANPGEVPSDLRQIFASIEKAIT